VSRTILDIHILQTVPPSNLNRDDTGSPKTAVYGGVRRARVSSQAWKRATRNAFEELLDPAELGVRTKRVAELVAQRMVKLEPTLDLADALAVAVEVIKAATGAKSEIPKRKADAAKKAGIDPAKVHTPETGYLMFLSSRQLDSLARLGVDGAKDIAAYLKDKEHKQAVRDAADSLHSVDIALFGRMVADATDINVDAAAQVAHAISVHTVENETDYFTAMDDRSGDDEAGAGMIGTVDFNSATLYRYAAIDVDRLADNLGHGMRDGEPGEPVRRAVRAFIEGFITSLPTGKINTFGNHTLPDAVVVKLRASRPVSFASAFEEPVLSGENGGFVQAACERLAKFVPDIETAYGASADTETWVVHVGNATAALEQLGAVVALPELVSQVGDAVARRVAPSA
jgi:CRISPR system Cascade subunit CasC